MKKILFLLVALMFFVGPGIKQGSFLNAQLSTEEVVLQITHPKRIVFFGESCVGKTTLMQELYALSDMFYMPIFTVTRSPLLDDDSRLFEYVSKEEYQKNR